MKNLKLIWLSLVLCLAALVTPVRVFAQQQTYIIERDDFLSIAFWQQPTLNTQIRVAEDGTIELPTVGKVNAAGYTLEQLEREIHAGQSFGH